MAIFLFCFWKKEIPDELHMIISRKFSGNVWTLELKLNYFNEELQAKEISVTVKSTSNDKDKVKDKNRAAYTESWVKVVNWKVINVSIAPKITLLPNAKRWLIDSHDWYFEKIL